MRLIDADALIEAVDQINWYSFYNGYFVNGAECDEKALYNEMKFSNRFGFCSVSIQKKPAFSN